MLFKALKKSNSTLPAALYDRYHSRHLTTGRMKPGEVNDSSKVTHIIGNSLEFGIPHPVFIPLVEKGYNMRS